MGRFDDALSRARPRRDRRDQAPLAVGRRAATGRRSCRHRTRLRRAGAAAISVLVDERFGGTWDDLRAARAATTAPLLAKGFFSTDEHLRTAKEAGADAVLLLLRDLDDGETARLMGVAEDLGLDTLVEAHDAAELDRGIALRARVLGVNARDLATFAIDRKAQLELVARIPADRIVIAESGIQTRAQGAAAELAGADAVLVGSTLMRAPDPAAKLAELLSRPLVKVCGLTREEDVAAAAEAGADLAGFILVPESPRAATGVLPVPDGMLSVAVWVGEAGRRRRRPRPGAHRRGRQGARPRSGAPPRGRGGGAGARPALGGDRPRPLARSRRGGGPDRAGGEARAGQRAGGDRRRAAVGGRRGLVARVRSGDQGSRQGEAIRGGSPLMTTDTTEETYGPYGGRYVPETLIPALDELTAAWAEALADPAYLAEVEHLGRTYTGRPSPITLAPRFAPGKRLYLKREDLNHTGAHKINNALGQVVLARRLGKTRIIAETGAGQHGVATATACARFGLECVVFMGSEDMRRQAPNVERMHLMGATVVPVEFGTKTLKEATSEAIRDWITNVETTHYVIGSCVGPAPYPEIVRELQAVIGREAREQLLEAEGALPEAVVACVGGGSNAIGMFAGFIDDADVRLIGVEAAGAASLGGGRTGVLHGSRSSILADEDGQITDAHSISAGLDYPGVGPEHAFLRDTGRAEYLPCTDEEALDAFQRLSRLEGIIPALESSHALAVVDRIDAEYIAVCLSGRGDKDLAEVLGAPREGRS